MRALILLVCDHIEKFGSLRIKIFVCDGRSRASLQVCRSLSQAGHEVHVGESFFCSTFLSNSITDKIIYPDPDTNEESFLDFVKKYIINNQISFIFPIRDSSNSILSNNISQIPKDCKVFIPEYDNFINFQDKSKLIRITSDTSVPIPKTLFGIELNHSISFSSISRSLGHPFIAKPIVSSGSRGIKLIKNDKDMNDFLLKTKNNLNLFIFQEFIPHGGAVGVYNLTRNGKILATNTHIRIREYPHTGGPSTLRRSGRHMVCEHFAHKILEKSKWNGLSMVEFRIHKDTKIPYLMEINPRFWGSLALDIHSGVDFPNLVIEHSFPNIPKKAKNHPQTGVFVRWLFLGDILWFLTHKNKIKAFRTFSDFKNQKFDILNVSDPLPVIGSIIEGLKSFFIKKRREHAFERGW